MKIMAVLQLYDFKISDPVALVTDTENSMTLLGKIIDGDHHYCLAHVLEPTTVCMCPLHHYIPLFLLYLIFLHVVSCYLLFVIRNKALMDTQVPAKELDTSWAPSPTSIYYPSI